MNWEDICFLSHIHSRLLLFTSSGYSLAIVGLYVCCKTVCKADRVVNYADLRWIYAYPETNGKNNGVNCFTKAVTNATVVP